MKKAVIFDMDGLMIDSERVTYEEYVAKLSKMGYVFNEELYRQCLGKNKAGVYGVFHTHYGEDFLMDEVWDEVHVSLDTRLQKNAPLKKGIIELLTYLNEHGYQTIVATSSYRVRAEMILTSANILKHFFGMVCGDEVAHGKPNPEIFLKACEVLGVTPDEALVLEDSEAGISAAHAANIDVICVPDMKYPDAANASKTVKIVESLLEVMDYLS